MAELITGQPCPPATECRQKQVRLGILKDGELLEWITPAYPVDSVARAIVRRVRRRFRRRYADSPGFSLAVVMFDG